MKSPTKIAFRTMTAIAASVLIVYGISHILASDIAGHVQPKVSNIAQASIPCCSVTTRGTYEHSFVISPCNSCDEPTILYDDTDDCGNVLSLWCEPCGDEGCQYVFKYNSTVIHRCHYDAGINLFLYYKTADGKCFHSTKTFTHDDTNSGSGDEGTPGKWDWGFFTFNCLTGAGPVYTCLESTSKPSINATSGDESDCEYLCVAP